MHELGIKQGGRNWDEGVHLVIFAARDSVQDSLGFTPFELMFGHIVRCPLKVVKEKWLSKATDDSLLEIGFEIQREGKQCI